MFCQKESSCTFGQWSMQFLTSSRCHFCFDFQRGNRILLKWNEFEIDKTNYAFR